MPPEHFYYHPRMTAYNLGPNHPLKPIRLLRTIELLEHFGFQCADPGPGKEEDALRVHSPEYVDAVKRANQMKPSEAYAYGFGTGDTPIIPNMYPVCLAYLAGSIKAAEAVRDGAKLAYNLSGGLHHAQRGNASGFCVFNDPAAAIHVLKEKMERIAYVDIDVHHGDGVQAIFYDDPNVLTCSIHQDGRTLYPGTGFVDETGADFSSLNMPLAPGTTGDVWLWAFENSILPALGRFKPQAIVLQMGTDSHILDPLAHLENTAQEWLQAVISIRDLGLPLVVLGGGGYSLNCVPRMWSAASMVLAGMEVPQHVPEPFGEEWKMPTFFDPKLPEPRKAGEAQAKRNVAWLEENFFPHMK